MKKRNQKQKLNQNAKTPGHFRFYAESEIKTELCDKLNKAKMMIDGTISNTSNYPILNHILDHFLKTSVHQNIVAVTYVSKDLQRVGHVGKLVFQCKSGHGFHTWFQCKSGHGLPYKLS